ncbi:hypothetical protein J8L86_12545 [Shewanella sp. MMG014]|nr:hypothetical protein AN944_00269 [Shewanella sp. P1-14-1]MBQ4890681.1 hypothetical protein [Shewanella sp. MMG014]
MKVFTVIILLLASSSSHAIWLNTTGKVASIVTYAGRDTVLVNLDNHGTAVAECANNSTFAISLHNSIEQRARMFAILLAAKASDKSVIISYSDTGGCEAWDSNPSAYRKITRLYAID